MTAYSTKFVTAPMEGRFAWCYLDQPRVEDMNGKRLEKPRYECAFYFPKTAATSQQCKNYQFFGALAWEVVQNVFRGQWPMIGAGGAWTDWPIDDCDVPAIADKYPWARGMWRVGLSGGKFRPKVFDAGNNPIELGIDGKFRPGTFKGSDGVGGDWGFVSVNAYDWEYGGARKGVGFGVEGIKVTRLDEQVGGAGRSVEAMFGQPTGSPVYGGAPPNPSYAVGQGAAYGTTGGQAPNPPAYGAPPNPSQGGPYAPTPGGPAPNTNYPTHGGPAMGGPSYGTGASAVGGYPSNPLAMPQQQWGAPQNPPQAPAYAPQPGGPAPAAPGPYAGPGGNGYAAPAYPSNAPPAPQGGMPPAPPQFGTR